LICALAWSEARSPRPRKLISCLIILFSMITFYQVGFWKDSLTFYDHVLEVNDRSFIALGNLGLIHLGQGNLNKAEEEFSHSISIQPGYPPAYP
jgi:tetratricopeptide (TPR) repeat protein